jgi:hypothetical protein
VIVAKKHELIWALETADKRVRSSARRRHGRARLSIAAEPRSGRLIAHFEQDGVPALREDNSTLRTLSERLLQRAGGNLLADVLRDLPHTDNG